MQKFYLYREELWPFYELIPYIEDKQTFSLYQDDSEIELSDEQVEWIKRVHKELYEVQNFLRQFDKYEH